MCKFLNAFFFRGVDFKSQFFNSLGMVKPRWAKNGQNWQKVVMMKMVAEEKRERKERRGKRERRKRKNKQKDNPNIFFLEIARTFPFTCFVFLLLFNRETFEIR